MLRSFRHLLCLIVRLFRSKRNLLLENLALRQQLLIFKRKHPKPRLSHFDRLFWVLAKRLWFMIGDSKFGETVGSAVTDVGLKPIRTSFRIPWQNGIAERWVGSCRRICSIM